MVIEGQFIKARYDAEAGRNNNRVTVELHLSDSELVKLQNGLANRRMDMVQMVINSSAVAVAGPNDTPTTSTESW
jgi:hypothetical protein